jgi:hypothetical protein
VSNSRYGRALKPAEEVEAIRASDLLKLMEVVKCATGLWNVIERHAMQGEQPPWISDDFDLLGGALRDLGLMEVKRDD